MDRDSPQSAGKSRKPVVQGDDLPALRACSDVAWLSWKAFETDVKNLNYFLSLSITNAETQSIVSRAIRDTVPGAQGFPAWGGYEFDSNTPEGQAILGKFLFHIKMRTGSANTLQAHQMPKPSATSSYNINPPSETCISLKLGYFGMTGGDQGLIYSSS